MKTKDVEDEVLDAVKTEVEAVFKKYDCGGIAIVSRLVSGPTWTDEHGPDVQMNGGVVYMFGPSFSKLEMDDGHAALKMDPADYDNDVKSLLMSASASIAMLQVLASIASFCSSTLTQMAFESTEQSASIFEESKSAASAGKSNMH